MYINCSISVSAMYQHYRLQSDKVSVTLQSSSRCISCNWHNSICSKSAIVSIVSWYKVICSMSIIYQLYHLQLIHYHLQYINFSHVLVASSAIYITQFAVYQFQTFCHVPVVSTIQSIKYYFHCSVIPDLQFPPSSLLPQTHQPI